MIDVDDELARLRQLEHEFLTHCEDGDDPHDPESFHKKIMGCSDLLGEYSEIDRRLTDHVVNDLTIEFE